MKGNIVVPQTGERRVRYILVSTLPQIAFRSDNEHTQQSSSPRLSVVYLLCGAALLNVARGDIVVSCCAETRAW